MAVAQATCSSEELVIKAETLIGSDSLVNHTHELKVYDLAMVLLVASIRSQKIKLDLVCILLCRVTINFRLVCHSIHSGCGRRVPHHVISNGTAFQPMMGAGYHSVVRRDKALTGMSFLEHN